MEILQGSELKLSSASMEVQCCVVVRGLLPPRAAWLCAFPLFPFTLAFAFGAARRWSRRAWTVAAIGGGLTVAMLGRGWAAAEWLGVAEASEEVASGGGQTSQVVANGSWLGVGNAIRVTTGEKWWDEESLKIAPGLYICMKRSDLIRQTKSELDQT
ncbi:hypothetical protein JB92DRAFT_2986270 [Gautieria morchelliformis]|nr:hypothetical protein JB92DRAFT_2986270 [Gautieria morchelliformis]